MSTPTQHSEIVLAIDPGFDRLGVAVLKRVLKKEKILFSDCIRTSVKNSKASRLLHIGQEIRKIITKWHPNTLAIETLFFNQNTSSAIGVAEARGVVLYEASLAGLEIYEYSPQAIKIAVTGYGKADKSQVFDMVRRLLSLSPTSLKRLDDEVDAIALGITHLATKKSF